MRLPSLLKKFGFQNTTLIIVGNLPMVAMVVSLFVSPSADPYERIAHVTGENALRFLLLTMAVTPIVALSRWKKIIRFRRTLGILTFVYALVHFLAYMVFEAGFDIGFVIDDVVERNFILVGMFAFLMLVPLGLTSNNFSVRKLGNKWRKLHRLAYPIAILAPVHYLMLKRDEDLTEPLVYLFLFIALLAFRVVMVIYRRRGSLTSHMGSS